MQLHTRRNTVDIIMKWIVEANSIDDLCDGKFAIIDKYDGDVMCDDDVLYIDLCPCSDCQEFACEGCRPRYDDKYRKCN